MILQKKDFLKVMQLLKPGLAKKDIIEQFTHYLFTGEDIITFNDEICISHPFKTDFQCSARAEELFKTVSGIKEETLEISLEENKMQIRSAGTRAHLTVSSDKDSEKLISVLDLAGAWSNMKPLPENFARGVYLCMFSASKDMTKGIYTCVRVGGTDILSSDGIRISRYALKEDSGLQVLIPARNVEELVKFPVTKCCLTKSWCHFGTEDGVMFSSRIMEGDYPDLSGYFTIEGQRVRLPAELRELVASVSFMTDGKVDKDKTISIKVSKDKITCRGEKKQIGEIERDLGFEYAQGEFEVQMNPVFLYEVLEKATIMKVGKDAAMFLSGSFEHLISLL